MYSNHSDLSSTRKEWGLDNTLYVELVRGIIKYKKHSPQRAHFWATNPITQFILSRLIPYNVKITPLKFHVNIDKLLAPEREQRERGKTIGEGYSIPDEVVKIDSHTLTGEWVVWDDAARPTSNRVILFLHGGE